MNQVTIVKHRTKLSPRDPAIESKIQIVQRWYLGSRHGYARYSVPFGKFEARSSRQPRTQMNYLDLKKLRQGAGGAKIENPTARVLCRGKPGNHHDHPNLASRGRLRAAIVPLLRIRSIDQRRIRHRCIFLGRRVKNSVRFAGNQKQLLSQDCGTLHG
jgi:hypothetical protein